MLRHRIDDTKHELCRARTLTQILLGQMLKVNQPAFSNLEWRTEMYI